MSRLDDQPVDLKMMLPQPPAETGAPLIDNPPWLDPKKADSHRGPAQTESMKKRK